MFQFVERWDTAVYRAAYSATNLHMMAEKAIHDLDLRPLALFLCQGLQLRHDAALDTLLEPPWTPNPKKHAILQQLGEGLLLRRARSSPTTAWEAVNSGDSGACSDSPTQAHHTKHRGREYICFLASTELTALPVSANSSWRATRSGDEQSPP